MTVSWVGVLSCIQNPKIMLIIKLFAQLRVSCPLADNRTPHVNYYVHTYRLLAACCHGTNHQSQFATSLSQALATL